MYLLGTLILEYLDMATTVIEPPKPAIHTTVLTAINKKYKVDYDAPIREFVYGLANK